MEFKLCAPRQLTDKELRQILDILDCGHVLCDAEACIYYFRKEI